MHLKQKLNKYWNKPGHESAIFRNMAKLVTGDGIARMIGLISAPIITRIYLPEHIGVLSVFTALVSLLLPFGTFRYALAIPLPKNDGLAFNLTTLSFSILVVTTTIVLLAFGLLGSSILALFSMEVIIPYWWLIPLAFAGTGLYEILTNWAVRKKKFSPLAKTRVWQKILGDLTKIILGLLSLKPLGLLIGYVITQAGGILKLTRHFYQSFISNIQYVSKQRITFLSKRYADFPKYRIPSQFLLALSAKAPLLYFAWKFSTGVTGQIGLALMMLSLPITLIGYSTGKAFYAEIAKLGKKFPAEIYKITKSITKKLSLISLIPFFILLVFGPWLFKIVFGEIWYDAGVYARILSIYLLAQFIYSPISEGILSVFEKQSFVLLIESMRVTITFLVFLVSYFLNLEPFNVILMYSIALTFHYLFSTFLLFRIIKRQKAI